MPWCRHRDIASNFQATKTAKTHPGVCESLQEDIHRSEWVTGQLPELFQQLWLDYSCTQYTLFAINQQQKDTNICSGCLYYDVLQQNTVL